MSDVFDHCGHSLPLALKVDQMQNFLRHSHATHGIDKQVYTFMPIHIMHVKNSPACSALVTARCSNLMQ